MTYFIQTIELVMRPFPIYHSDYIDWTILLGTTTKKNKDIILKFYRTVLTLAKDGWIPENIDIKLNGEVLTAKNVLTYDLATAIKDIKQKKYKREAEFGDGVNRFKHSIIGCEALPTTKVQADTTEFISFIQKYISNIEGNETFYYHSIPVTEDVLFKLYCDETGATYKKIRPELAPYLRYLNLSSISFQNADVRGEDLSYTNITWLEISNLYERSVNGTNLSGVVLSNAIIKDCDMRNSILEESFARIDMSTTKTEGMIYDSSVIFLDGQNRIIPSTAPKTIPKPPILHF